MIPSWSLSARKEGLARLWSSCLCPPPATILQSSPLYPPPAVILWSTDHNYNTITHILRRNGSCAIMKTEQCMCSVYSGLYCNVLLYCAILNTVQYMCTHTVYSGLYCTVILYCAMLNTVHYMFAGMYSGLGIGTIIHTFIGHLHNLRNLGWFHNNQLYGNFLRAWPFESLTEILSKYHIGCDWLTDWLNIASCWASCRANDTLYVI